jgi:DNA-binding winged helix-turn-helix (wHTH) protein/Flp pilus assembly protein TadD
MSGHSSDTYRFGKFRLNDARQALYLEDREIPLASKTYDVLQYFLRNPGRVITKEELLNAVWSNAYIEESNLAQHIFRIRKAFEAEPQAAQLIRTVPGRGYLFTAEVNCETAAPPEAHPVPDPEASQLSATPYSSERWRERTHVVLEEFEYKPAPATATGHPWMRSAAAAAGIALVAAGLASWRVWNKRLHPAHSGYRQVVLADFVSTTGDAAFDRTLKRALEIDLAQSPYMDILSERAGIETLQTMGRTKDTPITADVAREICERTNREVLLAGTLSSVGHRYLLTLEGSDCSTGKSLASAKAEANSSEGVLGALDSVADRVRHQLDESSRSIEGHDVPLREATTASLEALKAYSTGKYLQSQGRPHGEAIAAFQRAVELDPQFAMAYRELAIENTYIGQNALSGRYMKQAFDLSGHLTTREQLMIRAGYYTLTQRDRVEGVKTNELMASVYPHDATPIAGIEDSYTVLGQYDRALEAGERGARLMPQTAVIFENLGTIYRSLNRFDEAIAAEQHAAAVGQGETGLDQQLILIAYARHDLPAIERESRWFDAHEDGATVWYYPAFRGDGAASLGKYRQALELYFSAYRSALRAHLPEAADQILIDQADAEFALGLPHAARETLHRISGQTEAHPEIAALEAELGDVVSAERFLAAHSAATPDTLLAYVYLPLAKAAIALQRGRPLDTVALLESSRPYEMRDYAVLTLRAKAYLQAGRPEQAIGDYQKILDHPGIDPTSVLYPLAHLGLAHAYMQKHDVAASQQEYEALFAHWKDADPDLPVLQQARVEYANLTRTGH